MRLKYSLVISVIMKSIFYVESELDYSFEYDTVITRIKKLCYLDYNKEDKTIEYPIDLPTTLLNSILSTYFKYTDAIKIKDLISVEMKQYREKWKTSNFVKNYSNDDKTTVSKHSNNS